jgi:ribonuclease-3
VVEAFADQVEGAASSPHDYKSALQELLAQRRARVAYEVIGESGPPHQRTFEVAAVVDSERVGVGSGRSKKVAEQAAAERALELIRGRS